MRIKNKHGYALVGVLALVAGGCLLAAPALAAPPKAPSSDEKPAGTVGPVGEVGQMGYVPDELLNSELDPKMFPTGSGPVSNFLVRVEPLIAKYPDAFAGKRIDSDPTIAVLGYNKDSSQANAFLAELKAVKSLFKSEVVRVEARDFSFAQRSAKVAKISADFAGYGSKFGVHITSARVDDSTGHIIIGAEPTSITHALPTALDDGTPLDFQPEGEYSIDFQGRTNDTSPWVAGNRLDLIGGPQEPEMCTQGFTWIKWQTAEVMGSTAEHCSGGGSNVYNWDSFLGTRYYYSVNADTMLLRAAPGTAFSRFVWLGSATGFGDLRVVKAATGVQTVGHVVALSGAAGGLRTATTIRYADDYVNAPGFAQNPVNVTWSTQCSHGDSGAPWLTTFTNGTVRAEGQHIGLLSQGGAIVGCIFKGMNQISSKLSASIALG